MDTRPALTKLFEAFLKVQQYLECILNKRSGKRHCKYLESRVCLPHMTHEEFKDLIDIFDQQTPTSFHPCVLAPEVGLLNIYVRLK
jgi:hypothetical protein